MKHFILILSFLLFVSPAIAQTAMTPQQITRIIKAQSSFKEIDRSTEEEVLKKFGKSKNLEEDILKFEASAQTYTEIIHEHSEVRDNDRKAMVHALIQMVANGAIEDPSEGGDPFAQKVIRRYLKNYKELQKQKAHRKES